MLKRVVSVVEGIAVAGFVVFVVLLLAKQPESHNAATTASNPGAAVFASQCARCHGANGDGDIGPKLNGGAVTRDFQSADAELIVVTYGRGGMPAFANKLSPDQIRQVVDFTRTQLQQR